MTNERSSSKKEKSRSKFRSKYYKCHYCHKLGYFHRDCPKIKEKKRKEVAGVAKDNSNGFENVLVISHYSVCIDEESFFDLGCFFTCV